ncbi:UNVERIFIED_CONTAM: hypothetical protein Sradi_0453200 [Sesamum radiatum]|uniref:Uncharacterized protein n=1 Tax=Sesamum radiatum TaxID=300843 RepID=A0AAW2W7L4_SESRA
MGIAGTKIVFLPKGVVELIVVVPGDCKVHGSNLAFRLFGRACHTRLAWCGLSGWRGLQAIALSPGVYPVRTRRVAAAGSHFPRRGAWEEHMATFPQTTSNDVAYDYIGVPLCEVLPTLTLYEPQEFVAKRRLVRGKALELISHSNF